MKTLLEDRVGGDRQRTRFGRKWDFDITGKSLCVK